jgi:RimJ/RimL family protein N-acetyltransferase
VIVAETERLILRRLALSDAEFILRLVNEPSWLEFIGDKGVRNLADACDYLRKGPFAMYERHGFGLFRVELRPTGEVVGLCGLLKRDSLPAPDIGFAFLPQFWGKGYAHEAAAAVLELGQRAFGLERILAITTPGNRASIRVLEKIGLEFEGMITSDGGEQLKLFGRSF